MTFMITHEETEAYRLGTYIVPRIIQFFLVQ